MSHAPRSLRRQVRIAFALSILAALAVSAFGVVAFRSLLAARSDLIDQADPALLASEQLLAAMVDQETGVRGYVISADLLTLEPFERGRIASEDALAALRQHAEALPEVRAHIGDVEATIATWQQDYAEPRIAEVQAGIDAASTDASLAEGRRLFDRVRGSVDALQDELDLERATVREELDEATVQLVVACIIGALLLVGVVSALWAIFRRRVEQPLLAVGRDADAVSSGDLMHDIETVGPAEIQQLAIAVDRMRQRILEDLAEVIDARDTLTKQSADLERSNRELEQFAYVASHDLQEPLRKVASFCQLLQSRYGGQLDERADQYIEYAVDGAKRMQDLINDLLDFSRVGRMSGKEVAVQSAEALASSALTNLQAAIDDAGAVVDVGPLPEVQLERALGVAVFQNLIGNGIKFRRPDVPPRIEVRAVERDGLHEFSVSDNGIGIAPEYAERVFVIFQRLHTKEEYEGTGIGMAMCRKIVEHYGGRIWVDPDVEQGTTVRFTLPKPAALAEPEGPTP